MNNKFYVTLLKSLYLLALFINFRILAWVKHNVQT